MDSAMAADVIIHGDFVQFQAGARCDSCQTRDLKCALQETDDGCMACAGAGRECIFTRSVTVSGPKALYSWPCFIAKEPALLRLNATASPGEKPHPIIFNPGPGAVSRPLQTPAPSSARLSVGELPSPVVPRVDEEHPQHLYRHHRTDFRPPPLAPIAPLMASTAAAATPTTAESARPPESASAWTENTPRRRPSSPYSEASPRRSGVHPSHRASLGDDLVHSLSEQDHRDLVNQKNIAIVSWLEGGASAAPPPADASAAPDPDRMDTQSSAASAAPSAPAAAPGPQPMDGVREQRPVLSPSTLSPSQPDGGLLSLGEPFTPGFERAESPPASVSIILPPERDDLPYSAGLVAIDAHPWIEVLRFPSMPGTVSQPPTSNQAMMRYSRAAGAVETVSRAASEGSRRDMGEPELEALARHHSGALSRLSLDSQSMARLPPHLQHQRSLPPPPPPLMSPSGNRVIKPKPSFDYSPSSESFAAPPSSYAESATSEYARRSTGFSRPAPIATAATTPRWASVNNSPGTAKRMSRNRSLSSRASRSNLDDPTGAEAAGYAGGLSSEDLPPESLEATYESFRSRIRAMVPPIEEFLLERLAKEQFHRYKSLVDLKAEHAKAREAGRCPSGSHCTESFQFRRANGAAGGSGSGPGESDDPAPTQSTDEGNEAGYVVEPALFGPGIPIPPAKRLPADFECPFCFQVRTFQKPSDWSKHIQEDVAPFICTFPSCPEPKSFKRKADWVRHENERHRQLEWWQCNKEGCSHICYRRDNFVQHLVREHKMAEPKPKANPSSASASGRGHERATSSKHSAEEQVIRMVDACRRETTKNPADEPCRFCAHQCNAFKKLTVHLARHMEVISLPILELVARSDKDGAAPAPEHGSATPKAEPATTPSLAPAASAPPRLTSPINVIVPLDRSTSWHPSEREGGGPPPESAVSPRTMPLGAGPPLPLPAATGGSVSGPPRAATSLADKPYHCTAGGCTHDRGFATQNDLNRHMKGVHGIYTGSADPRYFRCQGKDCNRETKVWPRLDNFRGHVARMHPDEDADDLIHRSTFTATDGSPGAAEALTEPPPDSQRDEKQEETQAATQAASI